MSSKLEDNISNTKCFYLVYMQNYNKNEQKLNSLKVKAVVISNLTLQRTTFIQKAIQKYISAEPYLHCTIDSSVCTHTEESSRDVVANGSRDNDHGDAELIVVSPGLVELKHTLVPL